MHITIARLANPLKSGGAKPPVYGAEPILQKDLRGVQRS